MNTKLTQLNITYLDSLGFESEGSVFWVKAPINEKLVKIIFRNIVIVSLSRDFLDLSDCDLGIVEISHEFRRVTANDFSGYQYIVKGIEEIPKMHLITFHGSTIITIMCENLDIEK